MQKMYKKVSVCVDPYRKDCCKGCKYNEVPDLRDGGCILLKDDRAERTQTDKKTERHTNNR